MIPRRHLLQSLPAALLAGEGKERPQKPEPLQVWHVKEMPEAQSGIPTPCFICLCHYCTDYPSLTPFWDVQTFYELSENGHASYHTFGTWIKGKRLLELLPTWTYLGSLLDLLGKA